MLGRSSSGWWGVVVDYGAAGLFEVELERRSTPGYDAMARRASSGVKLAGEPHGCKGSDGVVDVYVEGTPSSMSVMRPSGWTKSKTIVPSPTRTFEAWKSPSLRPNVDAYALGGRGRSLRPVRTIRAPSGRMSSVKWAKL